MMLWTTGSWWVVLGQLWLLLVYTYSFVSNGVPNIWRIKSLSKWSGYCWHTIYFKLFWMETSYGRYVYAFLYFATIFSWCRWLKSKNAHAFKTITFQVCFIFYKKKKKTKVFNLHFKSTYLKERKKLTNNFNKN